MKILLIAAVAIATAGCSAYTGGGPREPNPKAMQANNPVVASDPDYRFEIIGKPRQHGGIGKTHSADSESLVFVRLIRVRDARLCAMLTSLWCASTWRPAG